MKKQDDMGTSGNRTALSASTPRRDGSGVSATIARAPSHKARKMRYLTEYAVGSSKYGGDIWARSHKDAVNIAAIRNIGEVVIGGGRYTGGLGSAKTKLQKLHEATFLGWIALKMGLYTADEILGDQGIVHEMVHALNTGKRVAGIEARFRQLQRVIPGHRP